VNLWIVFGAAFSLVPFASAATADPSLFEIDPRLKIELFAAEPDVVDPVGLTFDEAGRMYVVEMRDYPYGIGPDRKPGGTIRLLEDTDGDGRADKSTVFAKDLSFPTSIAPWHGGVFVTAPPDIIYLKDTNGDGVADVREVYFTGFVKGVTDSNVNGLRWGLDNRLHGLNGGNGGTVRPLKNFMPPVPLENADFSFDPVTSEITTTYQASGGFGLAFNEFGHSFVTYNINHIQQRILPLAALDRFPGMLPIEATLSISDHGDMARIYPISTAQTRPNHPEQAGFFSSAGGVGYIGYDAYPGDLFGSITIGDVVGNLLHRDVLQENGAIFKARRSETEQTREFIASRDSACRLTGLELGPDGALYVIDMQRDVIEHPDYIPKKTLEKIDIRAGENRGRIYRIMPKAGLPQPGLNLAKATPEQLVAEFESHNQWRRMTAQRLLVEQKARQVPTLLTKLVLSSNYPPARVHALWTLRAMHHLLDSTLIHALADKDAGVRENALQLVGGQQTIGDPRGVLSAVARLIADPSPRVRLQTALALGRFSEARAQNALATLLIDNARFYWIRMAALSSLAEPIKVFERALQRAESANGDDVTACLSLVKELSELSITRTEHPAGNLEEVLNRAASTSNAITAAALEGLQAGVARRGFTGPRLPLQPVLATIARKNDELFLAVWKLEKQLGLPETADERAALANAVKTAGDAKISAARRVSALRLLVFANYSEAADSLFANLTADAVPEVQAEALKTLSAFRDPALAARLVHQWPVLAPNLRGPALNLLLSRKQFHNALVTALEKGELKTGELNLDLEQRRTLLRDSTPDIQARAAKFIGDEEYSNRKGVVEDWLKKLPSTGNSDSGKAFFSTICAQCHRVAGVGHSVGPDLSSIAHRSVEDIASNILDPNMAINPKYLNWQVETKDGDLVTGIIDKETAESVTLLQPNEARSVIPRKNIASMKTSGTSLMPEGLEAGMTPAVLRDVIAFLQSSAGVPNTETRK
jgi:putative membrane-bound dehydrogenase-like protein